MQRTGVSTCWRENTQNWRFKFTYPNLPFLCSFSADQETMEINDAVPIKTIGHATLTVRNARAVEETFSTSLV